MSSLFWVFELLWTRGLLFSADDSNDLRWFTAVLFDGNWCINLYTTCRSFPTTRGVKETLGASVAAANAEVRAAVGSLRTLCL